MIPITTLYLSVLIFLYLFLAVMVIKTRRKTAVSLGHNNDVQLERRIRAHANFAEYVPVGILLLACLESLQVSFLVLHGIGMMLVAGRALHAYALTSTEPRPKARVGGMMLTLTALGVGALVAFGSIVLGSGV